MARLKPTILLLAMTAALGPAVAGAPDPDARRQPAPQALWETWRGGARLADCVAQSACPPRDQAGRAIKSCWYQSDFKTGFRCIVFCDYGAEAPWGSDGGNHCD